VARVIEACARAFALASETEVTLEANPETLTGEGLAAFRVAGVNRLSLGVQSFDDEELARLGRIHSAQRAREAFALARHAGFDNVSLDLMLWLPGQGLEAWLASVAALVALGPEHASLYLLELYPNAPLRDEMARGGWDLPPDDLAAAMYLEGLARLDAAGYRQYEISNVARPGRESRHNVKYWTDGGWLAFGCGAHGRRDGVRWRNVVASADYIDRVRRGDDAACERVALPPGEALGEAMFMGLRLVDGVDLEAVRARYGVDPLVRYAGELEPFFALDLLQCDGSRLRLTRQGFLVANEIMAVFV
jgi:oxygen-independent coproporphyrinogen-3 oxidase